MEFEESFKYVSKYFHYIHCSFYAPVCYSNKYWNFMFFLKIWLYKHLQDMINFENQRHNSILVYSIIIQGYYEEGEQKTPSTKNRIRRLGSKVRIKFLFSLHKINSLIDIGETKKLTKECYTKSTNFNNHLTWISLTQNNIEISFLRSQYRDMFTSKETIDSIVYVFFQRSEFTNIIFVLTKHL